MDLHVKRVTSLNEAYKWWSEGYTLMISKGTKYEPIPNAGQLGMSILTKMINEGTLYYDILSKPQKGRWGEGAPGSESYFSMSD